MPNGVFHFVAVVGDEVIYHTTKPQIGNLDTLEKRAFAAAIRKLPEDADPGIIQILVTPFVTVEALKNPPKPVVIAPRQEVPNKDTTTGRSAQYVATHPKETIRPTLYKDRQ